MKGWRTIIFNILMPLLNTAATLHYGSPLVATIIGAVQAVGTIVLRTVTDTPVGQSTSTPS